MFGKSTNWIRVLLIFITVVAPQIGWGEKVPIRVALVTGDHPYNETTFLSAFEGHPDLEINHIHLINQGEIFDDQRLWDYDVMVLYNMSQEITPARQAGYQTLLERGVGLVALHHGLLNYMGWPEVRKIYGIEIGSTGPYGFHLEQQYTAEIVDPNHPITKGMEDFSVHDETYTNYYGPGDPDNHILLRTSHSPSDSVLAWTRTYANARVFGFQLGHDTPVFENPNFRQIIAQGMRWSAGRLAAEGEQLLPDNTTRFREQNPHWIRQAVMAYEWGESRDALALLAEQVQTTIHHQLDQTEIVESLVGMINDASTTLDARRFLFRQLAELTPDTAVDAIGEWLADPKLSHMARYALEQVEDDAVDQVFLEYLPEVTAALQVGMMNSLGKRRSSAAVPVLEPFLSTTEEELVSAALSALGKIGTTDSARVLHSAYLPEQHQPQRSLALLTAAEHLTQQGHTEEALSYARWGYAPEQSVMVRCRALELLVSLLPQEAPALIAAALPSSQPRLAETAIDCLARIPAAEAAGLVTAQLPQTDSVNQVRLLEYVAEHPDPELFDGVASLVDAPSETVRQAALKALVQMENCQVVAILLEHLANSSGELRYQLREGLAANDCDDLDQTLVSELEQSNSPNQTVVLLEIIARRNNPDLVQEVLKKLSASAPEQVQLAAWQVMATLGQANQLETVLTALAKTDSATLATSALDAIRRMIVLRCDEDSVLQAVQSLYPQNPPSRRGVLLRCLEWTPGPETNQFLLNALRTGNVSERLAVLEIMATWPDADEALLLDSARGDSDPAVQEAAILAYLQATERAGLLSPSAMFDRYRECFDLADNVTTQQTVLRKMAVVTRPVTLSFLVEQLANRDLADTAAETILVLASDMMIEYPTEVQTALKQIAEYVSNPEINQKTQEQLAQVGAVADDLVQIWAFNDGAEGWEAANHCELSVADGVLAVQCQGLDPHFQVAVDLPAETMQLVIKARNSQNGHTQVFWQTDELNMGQEGTIGGFQSFHKDGEWIEYSSTIHTTSPMKMLRIDPPDGEGLVEIDWIRLSRLHQE